MLSELFIPFPQICYMSLTSEHVSLSKSSKIYLGVCSNNYILMHAEAEEFVLGNKLSEVF